MTKKYVTLYRVSTDKQGKDGYGIQAQRTAVNRFLASSDGELVGEFTEVISGRKTDTERPELAAALAMVKRVKGTLLIAKLDRLGRNAAFLLTLQNSGVDFVACDCPNADKFTVGILALVAQRERELISERTKAGLASAKARGVVLGTPDTVGAVQRMNQGARLAREAFAARIRPIIEAIKQTGVSTLTELANCLNLRGIQTRTGKGEWTATQVSRILAI